MNKNTFIYNSDEDDADSLRVARIQQEQDWDEIYLADEIARLENFLTTLPVSEQDDLFQHILQLEVKLADIRSTSIDI